MEKDKSLGDMTLEELIAYERSEQAATDLGIKKLNDHCIWLALLDASVDYRAIVPGVLEDNGFSGELAERYRCHIDYFRNGYDRQNQVKISDKRHQVRIALFYCLRNLLWLSESPEGGLASHSWEDSEQGRQALVRTRLLRRAQFYVPAVHMLTDYQLSSGDPVNQDLYMEYVDIAFEANLFNYALFAINLFGDALSRLSPFSQDLVPCKQYFDAVFNYMKKVHDTLAEGDDDAILRLEADVTGWIRWLCGNPRYECIDGGEAAVKYIAEGYESYINDPAVLRAEEPIIMRRS